MPTVALALGGGGARGLAHIPVLEALDEMGVTPAAIAGSSIGAIVGAAYAAGITGRELRRHALDVFHDQGKVVGKLLAARVGRFVDLLGGLGNPVMVDATKLLDGFWPSGLPAEFATLRIPFTAVATDLLARDAVLIRAGDLKSAVAASMAIPGLVRPVERGGLLLIDGAAVDPVPVAAVRDAADIVVAVDLVAAPPLRSAGRAVAVPSAQEAVQAGFMVMQHRLVVERLARTPPDIHLAPQVSAFGTLDFLRAVAILRAAEPLKDELKRALAPLL